MEAEARKLLGYVGANVRKARQALGMTQEDLAAAVGVRARTIRNVELAQAPPSFELMVALAGAVGLHTADLLVPAKLPAAKIGRPRKR